VRGLTQSRAKSGLRVGCFQRRLPCCQHPCRDALLLAASRADVQTAPVCVLCTQDPAKRQELHDQLAATTHKLLVMTQEGAAAAPAGAPPAATVSCLAGCSAVCAGCECSGPVLRLLLVLLPPLAEVKMQYSLLHNERAHHS
jgi:hypothetical protein